MQQGNRGGEKQRPLLREASLFQEGRGRFPRRHGRLSRFPHVDRRRGPVPRRRRVVHEQLHRRWERRRPEEGASRRRRIRREYRGRSRRLRHVAEALPELEVRIPGQHSASKQGALVQFHRKIQNGRRHLYRAREGRKGSRHTRGDRRPELRAAVLQAMPFPIPRRRLRRRRIGSRKSGLDPGAPRAVPDAAPRPLHRRF